MICYAAYDFNNIRLMLNRTNVNLADSEGKLEEIERQLKIKLEKAR